MAIRPQTAARVLVADDQPDVLEALRWLLTGEGYEPEFVSSTDAVLERLRERPFDLLLMDLNYSRDTTSGREGLELIPRCARMDASLPIVVMTGWGSVDTAVEAMRRGARSFVQKPWEDVTLLEILQREIEEAQATRRSDAKQQREFEEARLIQRGLLPTTMPQAPGLEAGVVLAAGQRRRRRLFRHADVRPGAMGVYIADVAGKGVPAALLMSNLQAAVRAFAQEGAAPGVGLRQRQPAAVPEHGQRPLRHVLLRAHRRAAGRLTYANAGHNPPLLVRANGAIEQAVAGRHGARRVRREHLRAGRLRASPAATASCSTPTASPRGATRRRRIRRGRDRRVRRAAPRARRRGDARRHARRTSRPSTAARTRTTRR